MPEQLLPDNYAYELSQSHPFEHRERLEQFKQIAETMSAVELAATTVDFIRAGNTVTMRGDLNKTHMEPITAALSACRDIAIEQCAAARNIGDETTFNNYLTVYEAARFEYEILTNPNFHPVTIPRSCDEIYELAIR